MVTCRGRAHREGHSCPRIAELRHATLSVAQRLPENSGRAEQGFHRAEPDGIACRCVFRALHGNRDAVHDRLVLAPRVGDIDVPLLAADKPGVQLGYALVAKNDVVVDGAPQRNPFDEILAASGALVDGHGDVSAYGEARLELPRAEGRSYGAELAVTRSASERLNGWLSYTLAHAEARAADDTTFTPQFDVRHVLNLVLAYAWGAGFESGLRLHFRSGKPAVNTIFDFARGRLDRVETRLPSFLRLDLNFAYHWATRWGALWITLQWLNVNAAREATKRDCRFDGSLALRCSIDYQPAVLLPNAGIRAAF